MHRGRKVRKGDFRQGVYVGGVWVGVCGGVGQQFCEEEMGYQTLCKMESRCTERRR